MVKVLTIIQMETYIRVDGRMVKEVDLGNMHGKMVINL